MKVRNLIVMVGLFAVMQCVYGAADLTSQRLSLRSVSKNECSGFSERELQVITNELDELFRSPIIPTAEWNSKVSRLLGRLPYSKYNRMYNYVMGTTYKKAINQKFQGYVAQKNNSQ